MFKTFLGAFALLNLFLCIFQLFTSQNIPYMIVEAMFTIIFYTAFLFTEEEDDF